VNEHADYYLARLPEPTTLLGLRLRPFSIGHLLLLHRIKSYFVQEDDKLTYEDLALSVLICSLPFAEGVAVFEDPDLPRFMRQWADRLTGRGILSKLGLRRLRTISLQANGTAFFEYMAAGSRKLTYASKGDGNEIPLPLVQIVRVTLLQAFGGLTDETLMDRPLGLCMEDFVTIHTLKGNVTMYDSKVLDEAAEAAKAHWEQLVARGVIKPQPNGAN
jgi:hypothetical protein